MSLRTLGIAATALLASLATDAATREPPRKRPVIGLALGGGSALSLAHAGVIRWLEAHPLAQRGAKRRTTMPRIGALAVVGATADDERLIRRRLASFVNRPLDTERLKKALVRLSALDRYQSISWDLRRDRGSVILVIRARLRDNAPPLAMFRTNRDATGSS